MIATDFINLSSNELWEEMIWLEQQPITAESGALYDRILKEIRARIQRRQYLVDHFG